MFRIVALVVGLLVILIYGAALKQRIREGGWITFLLLGAFLVWAVAWAAIARYR